jgi:cytoskeletal protein CcmA (bactofilin family)
MRFTKKPDEEAGLGASASAPSTMVSPLPPNPLQQPKHAGQNRSIIDSRLLITGVLEGDGELQVDGSILGDIRCSHLIVGKDACITGKIAADAVVVRGRVTGAIGANKVILAEGARVESDIFHKRLAIEEGAEFEGSVRCREQPIDKMQAAEAEKLKAATAMIAAPSGPETIPS